MSLFEKEDAVDSSGLLLPKTKRLRVCEVRVAVR
jgi:hypothetical protein